MIALCSCESMVVGIAEGCVGYSRSASGVEKIEKRAEKREQRSKKRDNDLYEKMTGKKSGQHA